MENFKPRVLIAAGTYPPDGGGPAIHAQKQFEQLKERGFKAKVVALAFYRKYPKGIRHLIFFLNLLKTIPGFDVVYTHDAWGAGFPALLAARLSGRKIILRIGGDLAWEREVESGKSNLSLKEWYKSGLYKNNLFYNLTNFVIKRVDRIVVPSLLLKDLYEKIYLVNSEKIFVVPNPIPQISEKTSSTNDTIIFASRLLSYKNLEFVIESLPKVFRNYPNLKFIIMGDGPERKKLENKAKALQIDRKIVFTGNISNSEVLKNTSECLLGLAPALTEFNPNYILQCLAFGKPFLISRENGLPFSVPEEFLFDPRNHSEFEMKLTNLLEQDNYSKALNKVESLAFNMSWDEVFKNNMKIITDLLNGLK